MKLAIILTLLSLSLGAQDVVTLPAGPPRPGAWVGTSAGTVDSQLHSNVMSLIELTGDRDRLEKLLPKPLTDGKARMMRALPNVDPAFGDEWENRMAQRVRVDDFIDVIANVYEKHLTNEEIVEAIGVMMARKEGKPVKGSAALQKKLNTELPGMMGEITGGATELAVKVSAQVGQEIEKEHPEYIRRKTAPKID